MGSDPEKIFPYEMMLEHLHKFARFGLIVAAMILPIITAEANNKVNLDEIAEDIENGKVDSNIFCGDNSASKYNERMRGVVVDMVRLGYI